MDIFSHWNECSFSRHFSKLKAMITHSNIDIHQHYPSSPFLQPCDVSLTGRPPLRTNCCCTWRRMLFFGAEVLHATDCEVRVQRAAEASEQDRPVWAAALGGRARVVTQKTSGQCYICAGKKDEVSWHVVVVLLWFFFSPLLLSCLEVWSPAVHVTATLSRVTFSVVVTLIQVDSPLLPQHHFQPCVQQIWRWVRGSRVLLKAGTQGDCETWLQHWS